MSFLIFALKPPEPNDTFLTFLRSSKSKPCAALILSSISHISLNPIPYNLEINLSDSNFSKSYFFSILRDIKNTMMYIN